MNELESLLRLRKYGLVEMGPTGLWQPSVKGTELVADLSLLRLLAAREEVGSWETTSRGASRRTEPSAAYQSLPLDE